MYTGRLIENLMAAVERAEARAEERARQKRLADEMELRPMFEFHNSQSHAEEIFAGAA
jgi:hypothetical protein